MQAFLALNGYFWDVVGPTYITHQAVQTKQWRA